MNFNKKHFSINNGKKILHKSRGRWITITASILLALGIAGVSTASASANGSNPSVATQSSNQNNIDQQAKTYLQNNEAYNASSFKNDLNNPDDSKFLTPNTWYRPKMIHQNGQNWVPSQPNDYRPILMDWAPDQNTQRNYLNYMHQNGYLDSVPGPNASQNDLLHGYDQVQDKLENKITQVGNTNWLHPLISNFVSQQPQWNINSEDIDNASLQKGMFYFNKQNSLTPNANSNYRLLSRVPGYGGGQTGQPSDWRTPNNNHITLLLANNIDGSNPKVQAENLNNLYYFTHLGTLNNIGRNDPNANFDGIRIDCAVVMDYDNSKLYAQLMHDMYKSDPNNHLTLFEDDVPVQGSVYGVNHIHRSALTQDGDLNWPTILQSNGQSNLMDMIKADNVYASRANDVTENQAVPNYSTLNHHDAVMLVSSINNIINNIFAHNPNLSRNNASDMYNAAEKATTIYENDQWNKYKHYGQEPDIPAHYALMLTNKDTVPSVYYGDMYRADKKYMSTPTPYFDAIQKLLEARKKYVAGGQHISYGAYHHESQFDVQGQPPKYEPRIIASVRYGEDPHYMDSYGGHQILSETSDSNPDHSIKTGIATIINTDPNYNPGNDTTAYPNGTIDIHMGLAHKNQDYVPLITSHSANNGSKNGLIFNNSEVQRTDNNGILHIPASDLNGTASPQMLGNLSVWVPAGAPNSQDAREFNYPEPNDGNVFHSNAGLDSHVLFEGFSTYLPLESNEANRADNIIPQHINDLKDWGITDFRFAPHYKSVTNDASFPDAYMQNGYAFEDRYDLGNSQPTKYGTLNDLLNANDVLHNSGIHTIGDIVNNQLYDLPDSEVVPVERTTDRGAYIPGSGIDNVLYNAYVKSSPSELQNYYGGRYLNTLKNSYPDLFNTPQVSNGQKVDPTEPYIHQWSAKYMLGASLQDGPYNNGIGYILHSNNDNNSPQPSDYYIIGQKLPKVFQNNIFSVDPNDQMAKNNPSLVDNTYTQNYHYNNPEGLSNDIESIVPHYNGNKIDYWDGYYLWNPEDIPNANQWYHFRTTNFSKMNPVDEQDPMSINNVAIPSTVYKQNGRSVEITPNNTDNIPWGVAVSGSVIKNNSKNGGQVWLHHDSYGNPISPNAQLTYFGTYQSWPSSNNGIYLAYSNNGSQFHPYSYHDAFDPTSAGLTPFADFRDPFVTTYDNGNKLVAYVAGGLNQKMFIMTSNDGVHWNRNSDLDINLSNIPGYGNHNIIETPNIKNLNGRPIMFFSCQNAANRGTEHVLYVTGHYNDNGIFQLDGNSKYGSIDNGFDNYAGNFTSIDNNHLAYIGWPLNWNYFSALNNKHIGSFTLPRVLNWNNNSNDIDVTPIEPGIENKADSVFLKADNPLTIMPDAKYSINFDTPKQAFDINLNRNQVSSDNNNISLKFNNGNLTISRNDNFPNNTANLTNTTHDVNSNSVSEMDLYLDNDTLEAYIPESHKIYTIADLTSHHNAPYKLTINTPAEVAQYNFDLDQAPTVGNLSTITNNYNDIKSKVNSAWSFDSIHANGSDLNSAKQSMNLINSYFDGMNNTLNDANDDMMQYTNYSNDARQHIFTSLVNNDENVLNDKLYQIGIQLNNLFDIAKRNGFKVPTTNPKIVNNNVINTINYVDSKTHSVIGNQTIIGQQGSKYYGPFYIPDGYNVSTPTYSTPFGPDKSTITINVVKNQIPNITNIINYVDDQNHSVGTQKINGQPNSQYTGSLTVPNGYHLAGARSNLTIKPGNSAVNIKVVANQVQRQNNNIPSNSPQNNSVVSTPTNNVSTNHQSSVPVNPISDNGNNTPVSQTPTNHIPTPIIPILNNNATNNIQPNITPVNPTQNNENNVPVSSQPTVTNNNPTPNNGEDYNVASSTKPRKPVMNHKVNQIALKHEYKAKMNGKRYVTLPKGYSMKVANTVRQHSKDVYIAKFNRKNVWIPASVARITGYAVTNKATSYPRWININDRNTGIRKNSNGRIVKNLRHNTLRVLGLTYNNRGQEFYAVRYNGHRVYITTSPKYVYKTYLQTDRHNFKVYIKHPTLVHISQRFTTKHHLHVINAGRYVRVRKVVRDNDYRTRFYISAHKYVTGNKYYVRFAN